MLYETDVKERKDMPKYAWTKVVKLTNDNYYSWGYSYYTSYTSIYPPFFPARYFAVKKVYGRSIYCSLLSVPTTYRDINAISVIQKLMDEWYKIKKPIFDPMYLDYLSKLLFMIDFNMDIVHDYYGINYPCRVRGLVGEYSQLTEPQKLSIFKQAIKLTHPETDTENDEFMGLLVRVEMIASTLNPDDI